MKNEINAVLENMTTTIRSRRTTPARTVYCTAASAASRKKPILRRIRPLSSGATATRQSATAREPPARNGKPPKSGADTLTPWKN
mgnify:FL=1